MPKLWVSCLYTKRSNQTALQFWRVVNSLKTWKTSKGVFWYSSARPRAFARFPQWLIRPWVGYTDFLWKLNCHDCWKLCWLIWITESVCTRTFLTHEFLRWSAACNQNTVANRRVVVGGQLGNATPNSKVFRLIKYLKYSISQRNTSVQINETASDILLQLLVECKLVSDLL